MGRAAEPETGQEPRPCVACGLPRAVRWRQATGPELTRHAIYDLQRCEACGSASLVVSEAETPELYEGGTYGPPRPWLDGLVEPFRRLVDWDQRRLLGPLPARSRVLEVGAGDGRLLALLAWEGHLVRGMEPSARASAVARARGLQVEPVALEDARAPDRGQDLVILWHVLEHLERPAEALAKVRGWLAPRGRIVVAVPNLGSLQARLGGDRWFHQDVPRHRTQFTIAGLDSLLARMGFRVTRVRHLLLEQNPLGMWLTLLNRLTVARDVPFRYLKRDLSYERRPDAIRDALVVLVAGPLLVPVALLLELLAGFARMGGTVVVDAVPDD